MLLFKEMKKSEERLGNLWEKFGLRGFFFFFFYKTPIHEKFPIQLQGFWRSILNFKTTFRFILELDFKKEKKKDLVYID